MEFRGMLRRVIGAGMAAGFAATLLVGGAQAAQAAVHIQIVNANTGTCLTLKTIDPGTKTGQVTTATCVAGNGSQIWAVANGVIRSPKWGQCLDGGHQNRVYTNPCDGANKWQKWTTTSGDKKWIRHQETADYAHSSGANNEHLVLKARIEDSCRWIWREV